MTSRRWTGAAALVVAVMVGVVVWAAGALTKPTDDLWDDLLPLVFWLVVGLVLLAAVAWAGIAAGAVVVQAIRSRRRP